MDRGCQEFCMDALNGRFGSTGSASAGDHAGLMTTGIRTSVVRAWETCLPERGPAEAVHSPWAFSSQRGTNCSMLIIDSRSTGRPERLSERPRCTTTGAIDEQGSYRRHHRRVGHHHPGDRHHADGLATRQRLRRSSGDIVAPSSKGHRRWPGPPRLLRQRVAISTAPAAKVASV